LLPSSKIRKNNYKRNFPIIVLLITYIDCGLITNLLQSSCYFKSFCHID